MPSLSLGTRTAERRTYARNEKKQRGSESEAKQKRRETNALARSLRTREGK
jgi:hypothetical protein